MGLGVGLQGSGFRVLRLQSSMLCVLAFTLKNPFVES